VYYDGGTFELQLASLSAVKHHRIDFEIVHLSENRCSKPTRKFCIHFEIFTLKKSTFSWDMTPCTPSEVQVSEEYSGSFCRVEEYATQKSIKQRHRSFSLKSLNLFCVYDLIILCKQ
jgi:hypothetical protein